MSLAMQGLPSSIPVDLTDLPTSAPCVLCLEAKLAAWDMDSAFQVMECAYSTDKEYHIFNAIPFGCAHMQMELLGLIHYTNEIWNQWRKNRINALEAPFCKAFSTRLS